MVLTEQLLIKCHKCQENFESPIGANIDTSVVNNTIRCPLCGFTFLVSKPDLFYVNKNGEEEPISFQGGYDG